MQADEVQYAKELMAAQIDLSGQTLSSTFALLLVEVERGLFVHYGRAFICK